MRSQTIEWLVSCLKFPKWLNDLRLKSFARQGCWMIVWQNGQQYQFNTVYLPGIHDVGFGICDLNVSICCCFYSKEHAFSCNIHMTATKDLFFSRSEEGVIFSFFFIKTHGCLCVSVYNDYTRYQFTHARMCAGRGLLIIRHILGELSAPWIMINVEK